MAGIINTKIFFKRAGSAITVYLLKAIARRPFCVLYFVSDVLYALLKNVIKYRKKVIDDNLQNAFPEKKQEEIILLRNKFYRHLCDVAIETIKQYGMSDGQIAERMIFKGAETVNELAQKAGGAIILSFHYNNWEWTGALQKSIDHKLLMVYNKMRNNQEMDDFLLRAREKWGGEGVQMGRAPKMLFQYKNKGVPTVLGLIADQSALESSQSWITFLNREAPFFSGPEKIARKTNFPVFFAHTKKVKRGHYECNLSLISPNPIGTNHNEILQIYIEKMEEAIRKEPEYYLWSHKRWKHKRPANIDLIIRH